MKKKYLLTSVLLISVSFFAISQNSQKIIDGIGKLKLGSSPSVINEIGYDLDKAIRVDDDKTYMRNVYKKHTGSDVYQLLPDKEEEYSVISASYHPSVKVYYIPRYEPIEGLVCKGLTLKYFNDSFYFINTENPMDLEEAFKLKYGEPKIDLKEESKKYVNGLGIQIIKTDKTYFMSYETGSPKIFCSSLLSLSHDSKGKENIIYFLTIDFFQKSEIVRKYDDEKREERYKQKKTEKLKGLDAL